MLEKIEQEAKTYRTYPALVFRYKGDPTHKTYFIQEFDVLCDMVHEIKILRHEEKIAKNERDMYKAAADKLLKELNDLKRKMRDR
jgi:hypothetical protein